MTAKHARYSILSVIGHASLLFLILNLKAISLYYNSVRETQLMMACILNVMAVKFRMSGNFYKKGKSKCIAIANNYYVTGKICSYSERERTSASLSFRVCARRTAPTCGASKAVMTVDQEYGSVVSFSHFWKTTEKHRARVPFCSFSMASSWCG